jgi:hypothetical protein
LVPEHFPISLRKLSLASLRYSGAFPSLSHLTHLESLELPAHFNEPLAPDSFPDSLTSLDLGSRFNQAIHPLSLPRHLESLTLSSRFKQQLIPDSLPSSLKNIEFGPSFNRTLEPGVIPFGVEKLTFSRHYDQAFLPGSLPSSLMSLSLANADNYSHRFEPDSLPPSLTILDLSRAADYPLFPGILPDSLQQLLILSDVFHPIPVDSLPPNVELMFELYPCGHREYDLGSHVVGQFVQFCKPDAKQFTKALGVKRNAVFQVV